MKKHLKLIASIVFVVVIVLLLVVHPWGKKPFKDLKVSEIQEITVRLNPPDIAFAVTEAELANIVGALNEITIYSKYSSNEALAGGQDVLFTIIKTDESVMSVRPMGNIIEINGIRYNTKNKPSEKLHYITNNLESLNES